MNLIILLMHVLSIMFLVGLAGSAIVLVSVAVGLLGESDELFGD